MVRTCETGVVQLEVDENRFQRKPLDLCDGLHI